CVIDVPRGASFVTCRPFSWSWPARRAYTPPMQSGSGTRHVFTVDVEDSFHSEVADIERWSLVPSRVERSTETLLELCAAAGVRGARGGRVHVQLECLPGPQSLLRHPRPSQRTGPSRDRRWRNGVGSTDHDVPRPNWLRWGLLPGAPLRGFRRRAGGGRARRT